MIDRTLPPWAADRFALWSLYDMLRFYAGYFVALMRDLEMAAFLLSEQINLGNGRDKLTIEQRAEIQMPLTEIARYTAPLPLSRLIPIKLERLSKSVAEDDGLTVERAALLVKELHNDVTADLTGAYFLMIPSEKRELYDQIRPPFGEEVVERVPDAVYDIKAASRCMALDEWTAAVFHLMRAGEQALRLTARELKIQDVDIKEWLRLIQDITGALEALRKLPKTTPDRASDIEYYARALTSLDLFRDAWRNPVSHSRANYDERGAMEVWNGVRAFMQLLASRTP